jgi:hypothetical protein
VPTLPDRTVPESLKAFIAAEVHSMPSPFPGMNPYIERTAVWEDFHQSFLVALRTALVPLLQSRYIVKVEEHEFVGGDDTDDGQLFVSDVSVARPDGAGPATTGGTVGVAASPVRVRIPLPRGRRRIPYLAVSDRDDREVVTVLELLSPANKKRGSNRTVFLEKRRQFIVSDANYIELDFLRGHPRMPVRDLPPCDYYALVSRPADRPGAQLWPIGLHDSLPRIPLPLRSSEPEQTVDLQPVLHRVYDEAGYANHIYSGDPEPPLSPEDAAWAASLRSAR